MSASSSIAAAKRRRGGAMPTAPSPGQRVGPPPPNVMTPQQRALLLQQQQQMLNQRAAQQAPPPPQPTRTPSSLPNSNQQHYNVDASHTNFQVVPGPNGMSIPLGNDGKPLHPGVLIMDHEKRITDLENGVSRAPHYNENGEYNIVIEEGEAAPWEEDIGMLNLRLDEFSKRFNETLTNNTLNFKETSTTNTFDSSEVNELKNRVNTLEKELFETKSLLMKLQTFNMETSTTLLRHTNLFEQLNKEKERENNFNSQTGSELLSTPINKLLESASQEVNVESLEELKNVEVQESELELKDSENPTFTSEN